MTRDSCDCGECKATRELADTRTSVDILRQSVKDTVEKLEEERRKHAAAQVSLSNVDRTLAAERAAHAETRKALDEVRASNKRLSDDCAGARKALDAELARVDRVRAVLTSCAWYIPDGAWLCGAVSAALADAPAKPAEPAAPANNIERPTSVVTEQKLHLGARTATLDDLAALERRMLLAVAEAWELPDVPVLADAPFAKALRRRAGK